MWTVNARINIIQKIFNIFFTWNLWWGMKTGKCSLFKLDLLNLENPIFAIKTDFLHASKQGVWECDGSPEESSLWCTSGTFFWWKTTGKFAAKLKKIFPHEKRSKKEKKKILFLIWFLLFEPFTIIGHSCFDFCDKIKLFCCNLCWHLYLENLFCRVYFLVYFEIKNE